MDFVLNCFIPWNSQYGLQEVQKKKLLVNNEFSTNEKIYFYLIIFIGAVVQPLPTSYLIFRAPSQAAGKCWLDALELSLRCSSLIVRSTSALPRALPHDTTTTHETQWSEADYEKHFDEHGRYNRTIFFITYQDVCYIT